MRKYILKVLFLLIFGANASHAAVSICPTLIELNANKTKSDYLTTSFVVKADKNQTIRYKVYPEFFTINDDGTMNLVENAETEKNNLVSHARFVPNEFTLKNGEPQVIRVTFTKLKNLPEGESRMVLFIEDVAAKEIELPNKLKNVSTRLIVKTRIGLPIYVDKGRFIKNGNFNNLEVFENEAKNLAYKLDLSSTGNSKVRYFGKGQIIKGKELIKEFNVNSHTIRANGILSETAILPKDLNKGDYTLRVILNYKNEKGENKTLIKETSFSVKTTI